MEPADSKGRTALHRAVEQGDQGLVDRLLKAGAGVDARTASLDTPLHLAAAAGHAHLVLDLIRPGTLDSQNKHGFTPLQAALLNEEWEAAAVLVAAGARPFGSDSTPSPLSLACAAPEAQQLSLQLLEAMLADPKSKQLAAQAVAWKDPVGVTALHWAAEHGSQQLLTKLLEAKADKTAVDSFGNTPLQRAIEQGHEHLVPLLTAPGTSSVVNRPIPPAAPGGTVQAHLTRLMQQRQSGRLVFPPWVPEPPMPGPAGQGKAWVTSMALHTAAGDGALGRVTQLVAAGADRDAKDPSGITPLWLAAAAGHVQLVPLLATPSNINLGNHAGGTPLQVASERGHERLVAALLAAGAKADTHDTCGCDACNPACRLIGLSQPSCRALEAAAQQGHTRVMTLLLKALVRECGRRRAQQHWKGQQQPLPPTKLTVLVASAMAPLVRSMAGVPRCAQLLEVVLDVLGPHTAGNVCQQVQRLLDEEARSQRRCPRAPFPSWEIVGGSNNYLAEALLLGWLGAEGRQLMPARLQRLVPGVAAAASRQQGQEQQGRQHNQGEVWRLWPGTSPLQHLMQEAVQAAAGGRLSAARSLLQQCAEEYLRAQRIASAIQGEAVSASHKGGSAAPGSSQPSHSGHTKGGLQPHTAPCRQEAAPQPAQLVHWGMMGAADAKLRGGAFTARSPQAHSPLVAELRRTLQVHEHFLSAWVAARKQTAKERGTMPPLVVAAVLAAQQPLTRTADVQQQQEGLNGSGQLLSGMQLSQQQVKEANA
jgi:ankyrin repeat protein